MFLFRNLIFFCGFLQFTFLFCFVDLTASLKIYDNLVHCYRGNNTQPWIGNSLQVLLELIRKVEKANPTALDIRTLSANILHQLRLDGIKRATDGSEKPYITPYAATGIMVPKFELLLKVISNVPAQINFEEFLTPSEICVLHRLISSTVEPRIRGDESRTCPESVGVNEGSQDNWTPRNTVKVFADGKYSVISSDISRCPIEGGVVKTEKYGTISPGTVIASIAAGLQPQMVPLKDLIPYQLQFDPYENLETMERRATQRKITKLMRSLDALDNTVVAGVVGDLAEVCVRQAASYGTNVSVGVEGNWNDTFFPRAFYLNKFFQWEMTDSEILAGIDGLHLAEYMIMWTNQMRRLRLSQIIDMFYSPRGIPAFAIEKAFPPVASGDPDEVRPDEEDTTMSDDEPLVSLMSLNMQGRGGYKEFAFGREKFDKYLLGDTIDSACERKKVLSRLSRTRLKDQTNFLAQMLQFSIPGPAMKDEWLKNSCLATVDKFFERAEKLLKTLPDCESLSTNYRKPKIDMTVILDGSRKAYESWRLISTLAELSDVSIFGSTISVVHGANGRYLVSRTDSIANAFEQLRNYTGTYPFSMSLSTSLSNILTTYAEQNWEEKKKQVIGSTARVIFVVSQIQKITQEDFEDAKRMIEGSFRQFPDLNFVFLTNYRDSFEQLTATVAAKSNVDKNQYIIIETKDLDPKAFATTALRTLRLIPKRLRVPSCDVPSEPEDTNNNSTNAQIRLIEYEDYLSPNQALSYRLRGPTAYGIRVRFVGMGYGEMIVCKEQSDKSNLCLLVKDFGEVIFNVTRSCEAQNEDCSSVLFTTQLETSYMKCTENDCQYPDQIRYLIRIENLECTKDNASLTTSISAIVMLFVPIQIFIVKFLF